MRNERILLVDDDSDSMDMTTKSINIIGVKHGHQIIAKAYSINDVETLMEKGLKPTVAIIDDRLPEPDGGEIVAKIIELYSPKTIIISFSASDVTWGKENWSKARMNPGELIQALTNIQH